MFGQGGVGLVCDFIYDVHKKSEILTSFFILVTKIRKNSRSSHPPYL